MSENVGPRRVTNIPIMTSPARLENVEGCTFKGEVVGGINKIFQQSSSGALRLSNDMKK